METPEERLKRQRRESYHRNKHKPELKRKREEYIKTLGKEKKLIIETYKLKLSNKDKAITNTLKEIDEQIGSDFKMVGLKRLQYNNGLEKAKQIIKKNMGD